MRGFLFWILDFIVYTIGIGSMLAIWLSNDFVGVAPFYILEDEHWLRLLVMLGIALAGLLLSKLLQRTIVAPLTFLIMIGALIGGAASFLLGASEFFEDLIIDCSGFWGWVGMFFLCVITFSVLGGFVGSSLRGLFKSLFTFDFFSAIIHFMIGVTAIVGFGEVVLVLMERATALFLISGLAFIGTTGGAAKSGSIDSFVDENGQLRYVSHSMGSDRYATTDGDIFRKTPGGFTNRHM